VGESTAGIELRCVYFQIADVLLARAEILTILPCTLLMLNTSRLYHSLELYTQV